MLLEFYIQLASFYNRGSHAFPLFFAVAVVNNIRRVAEHSNYLRRVNIP